MKSHKFKPHKGLRKRVRITKTGKIKQTKAGLRHRKSLHTSTQNRQLRRPKIATTSETRRMSLMLGVSPKRKNPRVVETETAGNE